MKKFEIGEEIETKIVAVTNECIFIDLGMKTEGVIALKDFYDSQNSANNIEENEKIKPGEKIKAYFLGEKNGELCFGAKFSSDSIGNASESAKIAFQNGIPVEGKIESEIKGGYEVKIFGLRAFCPFSQMGLREKLNAESYIGKTKNFLITEFKNDGKNLVLSNRAFLEREQNQKIQELSQKITEQSEIDAVVKSLHPYGAFVDIGGFEALLPISQIRYEKIQKIEDVLQIDQKIRVKILEADWENRKISVSAKVFEQDPWENIAQTFKIGQKIMGKISRVTNFGVFVNIAPGIDGLVHISTLKNVDSKTNLKKIFKIGAEFSVIILKIDAKNRKISLEQSTSQEQDVAAQKYFSLQDDGESYNPFATLLKNE